MRYCVVGNIIGAHTDKNGAFRHGTSAFSAGTKIYLAGKNRNPLWQDIGVIGLSRGKRFEFISVPRDCIVNLRVQKVFNPTILGYLNDPESQACWWGSSKYDKMSAEAFIKAWNIASRDDNEVQSGGKNGGI